MAWESRGGNLYYYRKKKLHRKVISEYIGRGEQAIKEAAAVERRKRFLQQRQKAFLRAQDEVIRLDQEIVGTIDIISNISTMLLLKEGFHQHRSEWRRFRNAGK